MNILHLKSSEYLGKFSDTDLARQQGAVRYIEQLASLSNTNINDWDFSPVIGDRGKLPVERNEINKFFFDMKSKPVDKPRADLTEDQVAQIKGFFNSRNSTTSLERNINSREQSIRDYTRAIADCVRQIKEYRMQLKAIEEGTDDTPDLLSKLLAEGFWELTYISDSYILLKTVNDVIVNHYVPQHGVKKVVNLGKYYAQFYRDCNVNVTRYNPQTHDPKELYPYPITNGHPHPHVASGGGVCMGELSESYGKAMGVGDIHTMGNIVRRVLTSYNDSDAYCHLLRYEAANKLIELGYDLLNLGGVTRGSLLARIERGEDVPPPDKVETIETDRECHNCGEHERYCECSEPEFDEEDYYDED